MTNPNPYLKSRFLYLFTILAVGALLLLTRFGGLLAAVGFNLSNFELFLLSFGDSIGISTENSNRLAHDYNGFAISIDPHSSGALLSEARLALLDNDWQTAGEYLYQVDRPNHQIIDWLKGYVFYQTGDHAAAADAWRRLGYGRQIVEMGVAAQEAGNTGEALNLYKIAVDVDPNYANANYALGTAYIAEGDFDLAERYLLRAIELAPKTWWYNKHLAELYDYLERDNLAINYFYIALSLNPSLDEVKARLAELEGQ